MWGQTWARRMELETELGCLGQWGGGGGDSKVKGRGRDMSQSGIRRMSCPPLPPPAYKAGIDREGQQDGAPETDDGAPE